MSEACNHKDHKTARRKLRRKLDAIGWGIFFIWIGAAILADLGWGIGLIGVGLIILGGFAAREYLTAPPSSKTTDAHC